MTKLLAVPEVMAQTGLSYEKVLKLIRSGELPAINVGSTTPGRESGKRYRVANEALAKWLESRQVAA